MGKLPTTAHLKQGNCYPDPIHTAKVQGTHWSDSANKTTITETPDSKPKAHDGHGERGWAPINTAAKANTYTGKSGSKRD